MENRPEFNIDELLENSGISWKREFTATAEIAGRVFMCDLELTNEMLILNLTLNVRVRNIASYAERLMKVNAQMKYGSFVYDDDELAYRLSTLRSDDRNILRELISIATNEIEEFSSKLIAEPKRPKERFEEEPPRFEEEDDGPDEYDLGGGDYSDDDDEEEKPEKKSGKVLRMLGFRE